MSFTVTGNALSISPGSLSFSAQLGASQPAPQSLQVSSGGSGVNYSVSAATSSGGNWLSYGVSSYYTPGTVNVYVNPAVVTAAGTYNGTLTITATGLSGSPAVIPVSFTVTGNALSVSPIFTTTTLPAGVVNFSYAAVTLTATGGATPYAWTATGLPPGLIISSAGVVSGTPTVAGVYNPTFTVTDNSSPRQTAQATLGLTITELSITTLTPSTATAGGSAFTLTVDGAGFVNASIVQWNGTALTTTYVSATQLTATVPPSLIASVGTSSITVINPSGAFSSPAIFTIIAPSITNLNPSTATAGGAAFVLSVNGTGFVSGSTVQWNGTRLITTFVGATQLTATVPANLIASVGAANITVVNPGGATSAATPFMISVTPTLSSLIPSSAAAGGAAFTLTIAGAGFVPGTTVQWNGTALSTTYVSGAQLTASAPASLIASVGTANVTVLNPDGAVSNALSFTIGTSLRITSASLPAGTVGTAYSQAVLATAGAPPYSNWVLNSGSLPPGLTLNGASGLISGLPSSATGSPFSFTVIVKDSTGVSSPPQSLSIAISQPVGLTIITSSPLPTSTVGGAYALSFAAASGVTPYKSWAIVAGAIPPGTSLSTLGNLIGLLSGTPTAAGAFSFTVQVTDNAGATATKQFDLAINPAGTVTVSASGIVNSASYVGGGVAPGEIILIFGSGMGPNTLVGLQLDANGVVAKTLAGAQVFFDNVPAPLVYVQANQVSAIVPYEVSGKTSTQVQVVYHGDSSAVLSVPVLSAEPGIFTIDSSGSGGGAILNQDGTVNSPSNPAAVGSYVSVYATGEGQTDPAGVDGSVEGWPPPQPVQKVTATVGGISTQVAYAGGSPGSVTGLLQVNLQIPPTLQSGSAFVVLNIGGATSQRGVTIVVQGSGR